MGVSEWNIDFERNENQNVFNTLKNRFKMVFE